jgi:hypothetical protein
VTAKIPQTFTGQGFKFAFLREIGDWMLYSKQKPGGSETYEVVKPALRKAGTFPNGKPYEAGYAYPSPSDWGARGFSYATKEGALRGLRDADRIQEEVAILRAKRKLNDGDG